MKLDWNKRNTTRAVYAFLVIVASILFFFLLRNFNTVMTTAKHIWALVTPFVYGFVIAYILNPILRLFDKKLLPRIFQNKLKPKLCRGLSVLLTYLVAIAVLAVFFAIVVPEIAKSITGIVVRFPSYLATAEEWFTSLLSAIEGLNLGEESTQKIVTQFEKTLEYGYQMISAALPFLLTTTKAIADSIMNIVLGIIISIYVMMSKELFFAQCKKLLSAFIPAKAVERAVYIAHKSHTIFSGFIYGKLLDSLIIGILCFIGMSILRMPNTMLISVIVGVTNVIPYFGPFIGAIPGALIILLTDPIQMIWFVVFIFLLQQFDGNILGPKILGDSTGLSAFWVIFAILVFGGLLGPIGMFIGVPLFSVIYALTREYINSRLQKKNLPVDTMSYASKRHPLEF